MCYTLFMEKMIMIYVVYDSFFGNTEKVAKHIAETLDAKAIKLPATLPLNQGDVLILGCPTRAFSHTPLAKQFIKAHKQQFSNMAFATFDTRMDVSQVNNKLLTFLAKHFGYAAEKMEKQLTKQGAKQLVAHTYFFVKDTEGPLLDDQLKNAQTWAKTIKQTLNPSKHPTIKYP